MNRVPSPREALDACYGELAVAIFAERPVSPDDWGIVEVLTAFRKAEEEAATLVVVARLLVQSAYTELQRAEKHVSRDGAGGRARFVDASERLSRVMTYVSPAVARLDRLRDERDAWARSLRGSDE